jgi:hypothetical protein
MSDEIELRIMDRINAPGWVTTRGILLDPSGTLDEREHAEIEAAMKRLKEKGLVELWTLIVENDSRPLLAAARPGYHLDKELEQRGAWAKAIPFTSSQSA